MVGDVLINVMEWIGTVAFAVSGTFAAMGLIVLIRLLAATFRWKLPKIEL